MAPYAASDITGSRCWLGLSLGKAWERNPIPEYQTPIEFYPASFFIEIIIVAQRTKGFSANLLQDSPGFVFSQKS
jgi:hypothetical protein